MSKAAIDSLLTQLEQIKMGSSEPVIQYANRTQKFADEFADGGHGVREQKIKRFLLRGLRTEINVTAQIIRTTGRDINQALSDLIINGSSSSD